MYQKLHTSSPIYVIWKINDKYGTIHYFQIRAQEAKVIGYRCNEHGIKVLEFSKPNGPEFHYEPATNITFGDQPHIRDPLDKKYVNIKMSDTFDLAGKGAYAVRDIPANITYSIYGGYLYDKLQDSIRTERIKDKAKLNHWMKHSHDLEEQWKNK